MCGIAGIFHRGRPASPSLDSLRRMVTVLSHRGPDETGIYIDDRVGLGHARLSIIDLSTGTQPMHNEDETLWITYNGEIFNYPELREGLLARGHRFYTTTDTEVLLHLFEEKGPGCLADLNGQFAFAIWDMRKKEMFLARDRVGIRPLHYTVQDGAFLFASEIKSLFMEGSLRREFDPEGLDQVFTFWTTLPGKTVFRGIQELPAGHFMVVDSGSITVRRYWDIPMAARQEMTDLPREAICEQVGELLKDAMRIRLRADVPVGSYLSGGLDSSGITSLVQKNFDNSLQTFGIQFEEKAFDESEYREQMVSFLDTRHSSVRVSNARVGESFADVLWHCEKPLLRTAPVPLYLLSGEVRRNGLKAVLTGEGADEVFGGYNIFRETLVRSFWSRRPGSSMRPALVGRLYPYIFQDPRLKASLYSFFARGIEHPQNPLFSHLIRWQNTSKTKIFFSGDLKAALGSYSCYEEVPRHLPSSFSKWHPLSRAQYLEMAIFMTNYLLSSQGDRVAMAHSVEIRMPFLDYRVVEFMGRVPPGLKILGLKEKYLLKKIFQGILPEPVLRRPKHPYRAPIRASLLDGKPELLKEELSDRSLKEAGLFDGEKVGMLLKKMRTVSHAGEVDEMALAGIFSTQVLFRKFIDGFSIHPETRFPLTLMVDRRSA
jgi:asparagine synthase (glutamine-hydrolysing)